MREHCWVTETSLFLCSWDLFLRILFRSHSRGVCSHPSVLNIRNESHVPNFRRDYKQIQHQFARKPIFVALCQQRSPGSGLVFQLWNVIATTTEKLDAYVLLKLKKRFLPSHPMCIMHTAFNATPLLIKWYYRLYNSTSSGTCIIETWPVHGLTYLPSKLTLNLNDNLKFQYPFGKRHVFSKQTGRPTIVTILDWTQLRFIKC